jgi:autotransporter-associated beta strand protein
MPPPSNLCRWQHRFTFASLLLLAVQSANAQTQNYFGTSGLLSGSVWSTNPAGPYTSAFDATGGGIANFDNVAIITGGSITVAGISATANTTESTIGGTIANFNNGIVPITVAAGVTLDFNTQGFTSSSTAGYIKNGSGALATSGGTYGGGFTLNDGTLIARGINAMGGNATPGSLTINGGAIGANNNRDFAGKYSGITVGGNFQLGVLSSAVSLASDTANLSFNSSVNLGASTRTITVGGNGTYTLGGVISGNAGTGLTISRLGGATGTLALTNANTYTGKTIVNNAAISINSDSSLGAAPGSATADQLTLDGGTVNFSANTTFTANRGITLNAGGGTIRGASGSGLQTFNNTITGSGALAVTLGAVDFKTANSFAGGLTLSGQGGAVVARFDADNSAGTGPITVTPVLTSGGNITLRNVGGITTTISNNIVLNANNTRTIALVSDAGGTFNVTGQLSGVGTVTRGLQGPGGEVVLSGDNSAWSGGLVMNRGTTTLGHKNALGTGTLTVAPEATFDAVILKAATPLSGLNAVATPISLAVPVAGPQFTIGGVNDLELSGPIALSVSSPIITNNNTGSTIFSGIISDGGAGLGLTLQGSGKLTLKANNTYGGATVVNAGTLIVNNTVGSATGTNSVTINNGATLKGAGLIAGPVALNPGATLAPGNSPGKIQTGSESWAGSAGLQFELNNATGASGTDFDLVKINGDLTITANPGDKFNLTLISLTLANTAGDAANFDKNLSYSWKFAEISGNLIGFDSGAFNIDTSNFSNDTSGATGLNWSISDVPAPGDGHELYLNFTSVPEPSTVSLALLAGLAFTALRRRSPNQPL